MKIFKYVDFHNLILDIVITLVAFQFIDLSGLVWETLPVAVYLIIPVQSLALFLLYSDYPVTDRLEPASGSWFLSGFKRKFETYLRGYVMLSWALGFMWILVPVEYLKTETGCDYTGAAAFSFFIGLFSGLVLVVRFFANGEPGERQQISRVWSKSLKYRNRSEAIILPLYDFLLYGNLYTGTIRSRIAYLITFAFLVYTETLFEIISSSGAAPYGFIVVAVLLSYFPVRMLLLIRPPFSTIEMLSAFTAFGIFVGTVLF